MKKFQVFWILSQAVNGDCQKQDLGFEYSCFHLESHREYFVYKKLYIAKLISFNFSVEQNTVFTLNFRKSIALNLIFCFIWYIYLFLV